MSEFRAGAGSELFEFGRDGGDERVEMMFVLGRKNKIHEFYDRKRMDLMYVP